MFQTFDDKEHCALIYQDGAFHSSSADLSLSSTWAYANYLCHKDIQYAQLWVQGSSLGEVCPPHLKESFAAVEGRLKAFIRACSEARVDLNDVCFYEMVPKHFLCAYGEMKNHISQYVFQTYSQPPNYTHMLNLVKVITDIKYRPLELDLSKMRRASLKDRNMFKTLTRCDKRIAYNPFKTVTGRLATAQGAFPALTLPREYRSTLKPTHDWFYELDFNAAELRIFLALLGHEQPLDDLHNWNIENVFGGHGTRAEAKKRVFAWMYNPDSEDYLLNQTYDRAKIKQLYFHEGAARTDFKRRIECDDFHAINYIIQSTAADVLFEQMYKVWEYLEDKKSFIKFCNHDSIMIDLSNEDQGCVNEIKEIFSNTRYGKFKINCLGGKNWGAMKSLLIR